MASSYSYFVRLMRLYHNCVKRYPLGTQVGQTSFLMGTGDVIAQVFVEKKNWETYNFQRTWQFLIIGGGVIGPALTVWYRALYLKFGDIGSPTVAMKKVVCDQGFFAPTFLGVFMVSLDSLQGKSWEYTKNEISEKYCDILVSNYCVWPFCNLLNFYLTPLMYQVLVVNVLALFWNTYVSWKTQMEIHELEEAAGMLEPPPV